MARFIILIPTLNGAATLSDTLATCCAQEYADCRILVSDNCSEDQTAEIVRAWQARDPRVEYMRPQQRVSMSTHWEFMLRAIMHEDAYSIVLGCDDALMPGALRYANELLSIFPATQSLAWNTNYYHYPDLSDPSMAGRMMLHLSRNVEVREAKDWLRHVAMGNVHYTALPNLYHGFTHTALLRTLAQGSAQMIQSLTPDIYLSLALCCVQERYVFLNEPLSLNVISRGSNGFSHSSPQSDRSVKNQFLSDNDRSFHRDLPVSDDIYMLHTECLLHVRDAGLLPDGMTIELRNLLGKAVIHTHMNYRNSSLFEERQAQLEAIADKYFLRSFMKEVGIAISQGNQARLSSLVDRSWHTPLFDYVAKLDPALVANARSAALFAGEIVRADQTARWTCLNPAGYLLKQPVEGQNQVPAQVLLKAYQKRVASVVGELWTKPAFLHCYLNNVSSRPPAFDCGAYLEALPHSESKAADSGKVVESDKKEKAVLADLETGQGYAWREVVASKSEEPVRSFKSETQASGEKTITGRLSLEEGRPKAMPEDLRRLSIFITDANCGDPRLVMPFQAGRKRYGWEGTFVSPKLESVQGGPDHVWLVQRFPWITAELLERSKESGTRIVHDLDDLLWNIPADNPNKGFFNDAKIKLLLKLLARADRATVSTEALAQELAHKGIPATVLPNCVAPERWAHLRPMQRTGKRPRIGWAGQRMVHTGDLDLLQEVMAKLGEEVEWVFLGETPLFAQNVGCHVESVPMVPIQEYPRQLAALNLDLALAPLAINRFNEAKSDIRLLHYGALGYPVVATDIEPHREAPVKRVPNQANAWVEAIRERIYNLDAAEREGEALRQWVLNKRTIDVWIAQYASVWFGRDNDNESREKVDRVMEHREMAQPFTCSIVIPVFNRVELTKQCLVALADATDGVGYEVIIVDNGSSDGTQEFLSGLGGDVRVIRNPENAGFAKACNQGAQAARGQYVVFLNNDTIPEPGWLRALVDEAEAHPEVAIVGSKLLYRDRTVQHAGVAVNRHDMIPYHIYRGFAESHPAVNARREFHAVTAACMLIRRALFDEVGGFDEEYKNGFEDIDLCLKVRERNGQIVYQPGSVLIHLESQTPGRKRHDGENIRRFLHRWGHAWWLVDEDRIYVEDGFKVIATERHGQVDAYVQGIETESERRAWELVAATQRAAHQRDEGTVALYLGKCVDWPADKSVLKWAALVAEAIKQPALAAAFTRRVAALDDPAAEQIAIIREALSKGQVTAAASRLEALLKHYPSHAEGLLLKAILHMQREQYRDAEIVFTTALNQGADRRKCLMGIGMASMGRAYPQGAWQTFLRVLEENPDDAEVIHWLLRAGTAQNRWPELCVQLRNYAARNPSDISVRFAYASVLLRAEQIEAARQEYNQLDALAPEHEGMRELGQAIAGSEAVLAMDVSNA